MTTTTPAAIRPPRPEDVVRVLDQHPSVHRSAAHLDPARPGVVIASVVPAPDLPVEVWPSVAEHFVYDALLYAAIGNDDRRNASYRRVLRRHVAGKVVLEVGTGRFAVLARFCVEAGARRVYAVEVLEESAAAARAQVAAHGLADRIIVLHGDASTIVLPELVDVCVSEIVGAIGGAEGAAAIMNDVRQAYLRPGGVMIPARSITRIAAITLPDAVFYQPSFNPVGAHYAARIVEQVGRLFDQRLCLKGVTAADLVSDIGVFEELDFSGEVPLRYTRPLRLTVTRAARLHGFLAWLNLHVGLDDDIDILRHEHSWLPVFLPVFDDGVDVAPGDVVEGIVEGRPSTNGRNPDYAVHGRLLRAAGDVVLFRWDGAHEPTEHGGTAFHRRLDAAPLEPPQPSDVLPFSLGALERHVAEQLPGQHHLVNLVCVRELPGAGR